MISLVNIICPVFNCDSEYQVREHHSYTARCPKCGISEQDIDRYHTRDRELIYKEVEKEIKMRELIGND